MNRRNALIFNTALLTATTLAIRCIGLVWQVWLVGKIGSAGIGLFTLVMSVGSMAATFAISGIRFTSTRLVAEELGRGNGAGASASVARCAAYALFFGLAAAAVLFLTAERIGFLWIGDARTVLSLEILSVSLPFISLGAVLSGYFTSSGSVYKSAIAQVVEELSRIALAVLFLSRAPAGDLEKCCAAVAAAGAAANMLSLALLAALYFGDGKNRRGSRRGERITRRMFRIAMPVALSAYARTALSTRQQILVPRGLRGSGLSADSAMSDYGTIHGMAFPVVFFPSCLLAALAELIVPELTAAQVAGDHRRICSLTGRLLERCFVFSAGVAAVLFTFSHELGIVAYSSARAGLYIGLMALLVPVMYMDMVTDGCLKGLGEMVYSMGINVLDSLLCIALVPVLLPRYGISGYIFIIFASELVNFALSFVRLMRKADLNLSLSRMAVSALCAVAAAQGARLALNLLGLSALSPAALAAAVLGALLCFALLLRLCAYEKSTARSL